jgi:hypothetical protein
MFATTVATALVVSSLAEAQSVGAQSLGPIMSVADARKIVERDSIQGNLLVGFEARTGFEIVSTVHVSSSAFSITTDHGVSKCALKDLGDIGMGGQFLGYRYITFACNGTESRWLFQISRAAVNRIANALSLLKQAAVSQLPPDRDPAFQAVVAGYRAATTKPELPEEARKFKVQAEDAVNENQFQDAADTYGKALETAPWWPEGHFNRALVLANIGDFEAAVVEMRRYLVLAPDAPDARAAQDKIYVWERKSERLGANAANQ